MSKTPDVGQVAQRLGMKPSEVVAVQQDAAGVLAQTCDGTWTLIRDDGLLEFLGHRPARAEEPEPEAPAKAPARPRKAAK